MATVSNLEKPSIILRGKKIILKAIALAIPTFTLSVFKLYISLCTELESLIAKFRWGRIVKRINSLDQLKKMCRQKLKGGLDFKNLHNFNLALVAKQGWRLLQNDTSFLSRVYKAKYFPNVSFFETPLGHYPFYVWCGIWKARCWLQEGCIYRIGDKI